MNPTVSKTKTTVSYLLPSDGRPVKSLAAYKKAGGLTALEKAHTIGPKAVIAEVKQAGLRGRGGGGFPAAIKWESVSQDPCEVRYLCCNGAEGEPGTFKDRFLMRKNPYQILEGMAIAAFSINARAAYIGLKQKFKPEMERLQSALKEMEGAGVLPENFIHIIPGPRDYLFGEEKAFLEVMEGKEALPRVLPPYIQGLFHTPGSPNPTIVNNAETLSNVPHIINKGADWFRSMGTEKTPGNMIITLCGDVKKPGMYEVPLGISMQTLLEEYGQGPSHGKPFKAILSGVANPILTPDKFDTPLCFNALKAAGGGLGSGGFIVYDETVCMVKVIHLFSRFLAKESCGQCPPCKYQCTQITGHLDQIERGFGSKSNLRAITQSCTRIAQGVRCFLPTEESLMVGSLLEKFGDEIDSHIQTGHCDQPRIPVLPKIADFDEANSEFIYEPL